MSNTLNVESLKKAVGQLLDPETGRTLEKNGQLQELTATGNDVTCVIQLATHSWPIRDEFEARAEECIRTTADTTLGAVKIDIQELDRPPAAIGQIGLQAKSVIAVGSGKGGVGKSTVAASLALTLSKSGAKVGLMDADVYGPSVPHLLGISGRPEIVNAKIKPIYFEDIPVMSTGFMVEEDQAVIWRGPMLHGAITQFLRDTYWTPLDYLIIDMPPGTGDIALTLSQLVPLTGAVVVCTPQRVALLDAVKAISMFGKTKIPMLGIVENMSGFVCPDCSKRFDIFGHGGARAKAEELSVPFLGEVPLNVQLRSESDEGNLKQALEDPICNSAFDKIARALCRKISDQAAQKPLGPTLPVL